MNDGRTSRTLVCPRCKVPFTRHGRAAQSSGFYRENEDVCIVCREGLDPAEWLPAVGSSGG